MGAGGSGIRYEQSVVNEGRIADELLVGTSCAVASAAFVAAQSDGNCAIVFENSITNLCECGATLLTQGFQ